MLFIFIVVAYTKLDILLPVMYVFVEVGIGWASFISVYYLEHNIVFTNNIFITLYSIVWGLSLFTVFLIKWVKYKHLFGTPILELLEISKVYFPYNILLFIFSSPLLLIGTLLLFKISSRDLIVSTFLFSFGLLLALLDNTLKSMESYPLAHIEKVFQTLIPEILTLKDHIVIGGYGNVGKSISERLLHLLYLSKSDEEIKGEQKKVKWFWLYDGERLNLRRFFPYLIIVDKEHHKWDYKTENPQLGTVGLEEIIPIWGERIYVPILSSNLRSDNVWNLLNLEKSKAIIQTFGDKEIENYLLQKHSSSFVVVRASNSTSYSEVSQRELEGKVLRFYPPSELSNLLMRRIYAAIANIAQTENKYVIFFIGSGPELYYSLKAWDKLQREPLIRSLIEDDDNEYLHNVVVLTHDPFIIENSNKLSCLRKKRRKHQDPALIVPDNILCSLRQESGDSFIRERLYEFYLPIRHEQHNRGEFKKVLTVNVSPELLFRTLTHLLNKLKSENEDIVPIFVVIGKEGSTEASCIELFKALSALYGNSNNKNYWIIAPYFFQHEFERLLESAKANDINLMRLHLFQPYKTIREGVSNLVG